MAARRRYEGAISILSILVCSLESVLFFHYNQLLVTRRLGKTLLLEKLRKYRKSLSGQKPEAIEGKCASNNFVFCRTFRQTRGCMVFRGFVAAFGQCKIPNPAPPPTRRRAQGIQQVKGPDPSNHKDTYSIEIIMVRNHEIDTKFASLAHLVQKL